MLSLGNKLTLPTQPIYKFVNKYSIDFDGVDDCIVTDGEIVQYQQATYSFWCKSTFANAQPIFGHGASAIGAFWFNNDRPLLYLGGAFYKYWTDIPQQNDGEWHHWVLYADTNDITNSKLYCDSVLQSVTQTVTSGSPNTYTESLTIGGSKQSGGAYFNGKIDEFAVYDRELTQDEITRMYNTYYSPNRVANGNFSQIGNEEVTNGDFSEVGSEEVTNGDFATDSDWSKGTGVTINTGKAECLNTTTFSFSLSQVTGLTVDKTYLVIYEISDYVSGEIRIRLGSNMGITRSSNGVYQEYIVAQSTSVILQTVGTSFTGNIDNVSVKEVGQDWSLDNTASGADSSIEQGKLIVKTNGAYTHAVQNGILVVGDSYELNYTISASDGGALAIETGSGVIPVLPTTVGSHTVYWNSSATTNFIIKRNGGAVDVTFTNISVKEVGQHWTFGTGWSTDGTKAIFSATGSYSNLTQGGAIIGRTYKITFDATRSAGTLYVKAGSSGNFTAISSDGSYSISSVAAGDTNFYFQADTTFAGTVNNIVVQELKHDATNLMLNAGAYQSANPLITSTKSMEFDGSDNFLKVEDSANLRGMAALTVCCWVKFDSKNDYAKVLDYSSTSGNSQRKYRIQLNNATDQKIQFLIANTSDTTSTITSTDAIPTDRWVHLVGTFDNSLSANRQSFYIDGVLENTATAFTETINNDDSGFLSFGENTYGSNNFDGQITEAGVYDRALTSLEVASLYNQGMPTNLLVNRNNYQSGNPTVFNTKQVDFDGTDDNLAANSTLGSFTGSVSAWVKRDTNTSYQFIVDLRANSGTGWFYFDNDSDTLDSHNGTIYVDGVASTTLPTDGNWHHAVVTGMTIDITEKIVFGSRHSQVQYFLNGKMSQVGLWNSTLTANEVSSLYNHGLPVDLNTNQAAYSSSSNLVGYWRMGSGTLDTYPLIADQTNATLGSEEVSCGNFECANPDGVWNSNAGAGWGISGGTATYDGSGGTQPITQNITNIQFGKLCKLTIDVLANQGGGANTIFFGGTVVNSSHLNVGSYTFYGSFSSNTNLYIYGRSGEVFQIDNVSIKQVNGNPAIMTNQTSSDIENGSPYANVIRNTDFINGDNWSVTRGNWAISGGTLNTTSESDYCNTTIGDYSSKTMRVKFDIVSNTQGSVAFRIFGSSYQVGTSRSGIGTYTEDIVFQAGHNGDVGFIGNNFTGAIDNVTVEEVNTGLQGYWKMGDGTNDEYPVIYDQTNPTNGSELVTNGGFATDSDWTYGDGWDIQDGFAKCNGTQTSNSIFYQNLGDLSNKTVKFTFTISNFGGGELETSFFGASGTTVFEVTANGDYTFYINVQSGHNGNTGFTANSSFIGYVDNVSVKEVQGNFAYMTNMVEGNITNQYPLTKIRNYYRMGDGILDGYPIIQDQTSPNLAHIPTTNMLTYSEDFSNAAWSKLSGGTGSVPVITSNNVISPDGTQNGTKIVFDAGSGTTGSDQSLITDTITFPDNTEGTVSVYLKGQNGGEQILLRGLTASTYTLVTLTTEWQRFSTTENSGTSGDIIEFGIRQSVSGHGVINANPTIYAWGAQIEEQTQATAYIKSDGIAAVRKATTTNLLNYSEDFSQSFWTKSSVTLTTGFVSPDGTNNAYKLVSTGADGLMHNNYTVSSGTTYTISVYLKTVSGTLDTTLSLGSPGFPQNVGAGGRYKNITVTNEWKRYSLTSTADASAVSGMGFGGFSGFSTGEEVLIWGMQLEEQTQAETYAKTTGLPVTIDLFTENNYGTMTNMSASDIIEDTPNN